MSDKPDNPNQDKSDKQNPDDDNIQFKDQSESKPSESKQADSDNKKTGALKLPLNWDLLPDNKASRDKLPFSFPSTKGDKKSESDDEDEKKGGFFNFNKKEKTEPKKNPDTAVLPGESPTWKKIIDGQSQGTTSTLGDEREVLFVIRGMIERVVMKDNGVVTMGRFDTGTVPNEEIDLLPYGALDRGVSRRHCEIQLRENQLYVTDLQSTNGTFLAGVRLNPNEATVLRKGDELLLGRLAVQILFR